MKKIFIVAGFLALLLWQVPGAVLAQNTAQSKGQKDDILIIEEDSGGDDILIIEENGGESIEDLREELDQLTEEIDEMRDLFGTLRKNVNVTGYGETHFNLPTDERDNTFDAHRFVIGINARFTDWIFLSAEIDYEHAAQALEFEMAYLDFLLDPTFNFRAGTMLIPVGFLNEFHEPVLFWTVERPVFHNRIIPTSWNGTGGGFFGTIGDFLGGMNYRVYAVNSLRSIQTGPAGLGDCDDGHGGGGDCGQFKDSSGIRSGRRFPDELVVADMALTGRVEFSNLFSGFQLGASFYTGDTTHQLIEQGGRTTIIEGDIKYRRKWFEMNASVANVHINNAAELNAFAISQGNALGNIASNILGYNAQFGIHVMQLLGRSTSHDVVAHFMYEFIDTQNEMPTGFAPNNGTGGETDVYTAGVTWFPSTRNVALKMDYTHQTFNDGTSNNQVNFGMAYMFF
jgi:hypothetical protein